MNSAPLQSTNETTGLLQHVTMDVLGFLQGITGIDASLHRVAADVVCMQILIANICFVGLPGAKSGQWILVDAGLPHSAGRILEAADRIFQPDSRPHAIILTHGHFDHVGAVTDLIERWNIPVYAHALELPYLTGQANYPPPDPSVDNGLMATISPLYPNQGINLRDRVHPLPIDGSIPGMPGWRWISTPGHTPGHISLFRDADHMLIAGDAFTTVKQESASAVLSQDAEVHGPLSYFTTDWQPARQSLVLLESLKPTVAVTGHGAPLRGEKLSQQLAVLAQHFDVLARPKQGRYIH